MHEISLVQALMRQVCNIAKKNGADQVKKVVVKIGPLSGIVIDSFIFAFNAIKTEMEITQKAQLEIESGQLKYICRECGKEFEIEDTEKWPQSGLFAHSNTICPGCKGAKVVPIEGDDLLLLRLEME